MLRLRPYKACDAKTIISWIKDEVSFRRWCADRFESYPITEDDLNGHYNAAAYEDNFYEMTAFDETGVVGHMIMRFTDEEKKILRFGFVIVDDTKRGKGYGKQMIKVAAAYAFDILKVEKITIGVFENNAPAYHCYLSAGFKDLKQTEEYQILNEKWKCRELELIHNVTLYENIPEETGRLPREMEVYRLLAHLGIPFKRLDHEPMATIEACQGIDRILGIHMCKNLFLCNSQKTQFYLLLMPGEKKFKTKELSKQIKSARLSFAPEEAMEEYLHISPGAVSIMGLMNDKENHVKLLIDEDVLKEEFLGCHPCVNTASLKLKTKDVVEKFLPFTAHEYQVVHLVGEE